jgi:uncharacterized OB-fold protein
MDIGFDYTRSLGGVLGRFAAGLADRRIVGVRGSDGRVHVPPAEYDPITSQPLADPVEVADTGTVLSWSWAAEPLAGQPVQRPFGWALIRLDGADTALLHAVHAGSPEAMSTGMRVRARWADEPIGHITDIAYFLPEGAADADPAPTPPRPSAAERSGGEDPTTMIAPVQLRYHYRASEQESAYVRAMAEGRLLAMRCPACGKVYLPPRGACPVDGVPTSEEVELAGTGTVTSFAIVNVPFMGQAITPPYAVGYVLLDGADIPLLHLVLGCDASEVRMGMRVRAAWKPREEWGISAGNLAHFEPSGEPDADFASYAHHL